MPSVAPQTPAQLGIANNVEGLLDIRIGMDVAVAVAIKMEQCRHLGFVTHQLHQTAAAARNDEIYIVDSMQQRGYGIPVGGLNRLNGAFRQASSFEPSLHAGYNLAR